MKKAAVVRLIVAAGLFLGWIGYLVYLVFTASKPTVLSRPQFLVADFVVIGQVKSLDDPVEVREVFREDRPHAPKVGASIRVTNLAECRRPARGDEPVETIPKDFQKAGLYILPLRPGRKEDEFSVVEIPYSSGAYKTGVPRIYPLTDETRAQLKQVLP